LWPESAAADISPVALHDALPISLCRDRGRHGCRPRAYRDVYTASRGKEPGEAADSGRQHDGLNRFPGLLTPVGLGTFPPLQIRGDRKSTRLNSSHVKISYAVFCL